MSDAAVQTQREGEVLTITEQLVPQVLSCRRGEGTWSVGETGDDGVERKPGKRERKEKGGGACLFSPGAYR